MKMSELKDLTVTELMAKSRDLRQELFNLKLQKASSTRKRPMNSRTYRYWRTERM